MGAIELQTPQTIQDLKPYPMYRIPSSVSHISALTFKTKPHLLYIDIPKTFLTPFYSIKRTKTI